MRSIFASASLLSLLITTTPARAERTPSTPDGELGVVHLLTSSGSCSAFLVRPSTFLTAKHCVQLPGPAAEIKSAITIVVDDGGGEKGVAIGPSAVWAAPGAWTDDFDIDGHDFGVVQLAEHYEKLVPGVTPLPIYQGDVTKLVGREAYQIGFGFHDGNYTRKRTDTKITDVGTTITVKPAVGCAGDSGGVLLLKDTHEAVGIASREWPLGSDPCQDPATVTGYREPDATYFQRIDLQAKYIDAPPGPEDAKPKETSDSSGGCAIGASADPARVSLAGLVTILALFLGNKRPRRT